MEPTEDVKPKRYRSRLIAWVCIVVLCLVAVIVTIDVVLVVLEMNRINRDVRPPKLEIVLPALKRVNDTPTSITLTAVRKVEASGEFIPVVKEIPEQFRKDVERINVAHRKMLESYAAYVNDAPRLSFTEAHTRLNEISLAWMSAVQTYFAAVAGHPFPTGKIDMDFQPRLNAQLRLDNAIRHENWLWAYATCKEAGYGKREQYYFLLKSGPTGKRFIALMTTARYITALKDSVMSIGPDFHWPRLEDDD